MIKDTLFPWSADAVLRIQRRSQVGKALVTLIQPESTEEGNLFVARSITAAIDAQPSRKTQS